MLRNRQIFFPVWFSLVTVFSLFLSSVGQGEESADPGTFSLKLEEGKVTLWADGIPLGTILEELSLRAGFELFLYTTVDEKLTADFRGLPLEDALARLLPNYGFLFRPSRDGELALRAVAVVPSGPGGEGIRSRFSFQPFGRLAYGSGPGQAGRIAIPEVERQGPQSFTPGPGGEIYLADTVNRRIQVFGPEGKLEREISLPGAPRDIAVSGEGEVFVLDDPGRTVFRFDAGGERRADVEVPIGLSSRLESMRFAGGDLLLRTRDGEEYEVFGPDFALSGGPERGVLPIRGSRLPSGDFCRVRKASGEEAEVTITGADGEAGDAFSVPVERLVSVAFLGASPAGDIYLQVEQIRPDGIGVDLGVLVLNPTGILIDRIEQIPNNYSNWTSRLLQVDPRGDVFQMLPSPEAVELNRWSRDREEASRE